MNKQELIEKYEYELKLLRLQFGEILRTKIYEELLDDLKQLVEPQKPAVPQFVADWYEENKDDFEGNLFRCAHNIPSTFDGAKLNEFERWFLNASIKAFQILVNMHQFGYTVDEEKRYLVKTKAILGQYLERYYLNNEELTPQFKRTQPTGSDELPTFTRKELESVGFGWVFDCPGIEIEEAEK
jgi:gp178|nr:MAG TPA: Protein of unknown function (DUF1642) [Caudoviricetes sp.]